MDGTSLLFSYEAMTSVLNYFKTLAIFATEADLERELIIERIC